jgi:hypothetical protein
MSGRGSVVQKVGRCQQTVVKCLADGDVQREHRKGVGSQRHSR